MNKFPLAQVHKDLSGETRGGSTYWVHGCCRCQLPPHLGRGRGPADPRVHRCQGRCRARVGRPRERGCTKLFRQETGPKQNQGNTSVQCMLQSYMCARPQDEFIKMVYMVAARWGGSALWSQEVSCHVLHKQLFTPLTTCCWSTH